MDDLLFEVVKFVLIVAVMVIVRYLVPYIKERLELSKLSWLNEWVDKAVYAAEQTVTGEGSGSERKVIVVDFIKSMLIKKNISISDKQIDNLIEAAVYAMKQGKKE